jgi:predicted ATPase/DNA-binding CsgD family transcriptional regulator
MGGLPVRLTRFFGRDAEGAAVENAVARARLVTLTGAPGCGKTRLGIELGARLAERFRDGVALVELAPIPDPGRVTSAVGLALGIDEEAGRPMADTLADALAGAELLLMLDNCEHVDAAAAELAGRVVAACPGVRILATSRIPLGLPGEQVWSVPPLERAPAVELFIDRARLAAGGIATDASARALVERICDRLDDLPLAIELAAAWTRVLTPGEILVRLDAALPLLATGARGASARQQTMEAAVEWSYRLLPAAEQQLFDRLSVFAGGFDLRAVEAVAAPEEALGGLSALVDHSLVVADPAPAGSMRYRLLEPVRQCGETWLADRGERDEIAGRHAVHYLEVARDADVGLRGGDRAPALERLEQEHGNFLLALEWARGGRSDLGLRLCASLAGFWELRGRVNDGRAWLDEMLTIDAPDRRLRATALSRAARLAWRQQDHERARALLQESLAIVRDLGDDLAVARRLRSLALVAMSEDDAETAIRLCEQSAAIFRANDDEPGLVWALVFLGWARYVDGDFAGGDRHMCDALAVNRPAGSVAATVNALLGRAYGVSQANRPGNPAAQRTHLVAALTTMRDEGGGAVEEPDWLWAGAGLAEAEDRVRSAFRLAGAAEALGRRGGTHTLAVIRPLEASLESAARRIGRAAADRLKAEGARMSLDDLIAEAIAEPGADPLSPREREVAELVAQGLSNVEIATALVISKRTVESHVDHIKQKLGLRTRHQVMAWAMREAPDP